MRTMFLQDYAADGGEGFSALHCTVLNKHCGTELTMHKWLLMCHFCFYYVSILYFPVSPFIFGSRNT